MNNAVQTLVNEIKEGLSQVSSSNKDEIRVMQAMLNDTKYEVGVYGNSGLKDTYNPAKDYKGMVAGIISSTTKISKEEAVSLANEHEATKAEATSMVNISKEFVNTYLHTGRKLCFGGRENSDIAISGKEIKETVKTYPKKVGINEDGSARYEPGKRTVPAHFTGKLYGSCPDWVK